MSTDNVELDRIQREFTPSAGQEKARGQKLNNHSEKGMEEEQFSKRPKSLFASVRKKSYRKQKQFTNIFPCPKSVDLTSPEFGSISSFGIVSSLANSPNSASMRRLRMARRKARSVVISSYQPNNGNPIIFC